MRSWSLLCCSIVLGHAALAQTASNLAALKGLAPVAALAASQAGRAALAANLRVTGDIQTGAETQPLPLPFPFEEAQSLRDAFITGGNLAELADGLGTTLGPIYRAHADYSSPKSFTSISPDMSALVDSTLDVVESDSQTAKYFFANETTDGKTPVSSDAVLLIARERGTPDVFGRAYDLPAGAAGADPFGDSRPFQTEPRLRRFDAVDYFGRPSDNSAYLRGPVQNLQHSPSYPSGHTAYGTTGALLLGLLVPARFPQEIARAAEYGNNRIVLGAHYAMDVIGGRTLAYYDMAHLLANDPDYVGQKLRHAARVTDFTAALEAARRTVTPVLEQGCGQTLAACAAADDGRFRDAGTNAALVAATLTYGLPVVHPATAHAREDVATRAPEAGGLLTAAYSWLTLAQADTILTATEGTGGGFLDDGSAFGLYSRLDLFAASMRAEALRPAGSGQAKKARGSAPGPR